MTVLSQSQQDRQSAITSRVASLVEGPWLITAAVMLATFMEILDGTVVNVSLTHIAGSLSATPNEATWALTSYLVANGIVIPISGWLANRIGRKNLLLVSTGGFTAASLLCGIAPSMGLLVTFRVIQGACGGSLQPLSQAVMLEAFPPKQHGKVLEPMARKTPVLATPAAGRAISWSMAGAAISSTAATRRPWPTACKRSRDAPVRPALGRRGFSADRHALR